MPILCLLVNEPLNKICQCYMKKMSGRKEQPCVSPLNGILWEVTSIGK